MTPNQAAEAIMADIMTRKGFPELMQTVYPETRERIIEAWVLIIESVDE